MLPSQQYNIDFVQQELFMAEQEEIPDETNEITSIQDKKHSPEICCWFLFC